MPILNPHLMLVTLLKEREHSWLEFKHNNSEPTMIGRQICACANAAILANVPYAYIVFGVEDESRKPVGTTVRLLQLKQGGEFITNWIPRLLNPQIRLEFCDFEVDGKSFAIIRIEPTYTKPVKFSGNAFIRINQHVKQLSEFPEYERAIWAITSRRHFEDAIALPNQSASRVMELLDIDMFYRLSCEDKPQNDSEILRRLSSCEYIHSDMEGGYNITNLGAVLFARDISHFPTIVNKALRIVRYTGIDKTEASGEREIRAGYAAGFQGVLQYILRHVPSKEQYIEGVRTSVPIYPEIAIREVVANALIHQDFLVFGAGPMVEIYSDRIEITNPGNSLIPIDRLIDERKTRNEKIAKGMRGLGLCEERGSGLDKVLLEIEKQRMPVFDIEPSENSMRFVLVAPKPFHAYTKSEKLKACFWHCVLRYCVYRDYMSNTTLRERFGLPPEDYQAVSAIIAECKQTGRIAPAEENQGNRNARYVPYWTR